MVARPSSVRGPRRRKPPRDIVLIFRPTRRQAATRVRTGSSRTIPKWLRRVSEAISEVGGFSSPCAMTYGSI